MGLFDEVLKGDETLFKNEIALDYDFLPKILPAAYIILIWREALFKNHRLWMVRVSFLLTSSICHSPRLLIVFTAATMIVARRTKPTLRVK